MKVLLFGGEGFIGSSVKRVMQERNCVVKTFDLGATADTQGSVADQKSVSDAIQRFDPDRIVNLAGLVGVPTCSKDPERAFQANVQGAWNIARACANMQKQLIHVSSTSVYGSIAATKRTVTEEEQCDPVSTYGYTKYIGECAVRSVCVDQGLSSIILRPSSVYGKNQLERNVISVFVERATQRLPVTVFGDGKQTKCFTYVVDIAEAIALVALSEWRVSPGKTDYYNVSVGSNWTLLELVKALENHFGKIEVHHEPVRKGDFSEAVYSIERLKKDFSYTPRYSLERGLAETLA